MAEAVFVLPGSRLLSHCPGGSSTVCCCRSSPPGGPAAAVREAAVVCPTAALLQWGLGGGEEGGSRSRLVKSNVRNLLQERSIRESKKGLARQEQRIGGMVVGNFN